MTKPRLNRVAHWRSGLAVALALCCAHANSENSALVKDKAEIDIKPAVNGPLPSDAPAAALAIEREFLQIERLISLGQHQEAMRITQQLARVTGENWRIHYLQGVSLVGMAQWEAAVAQLNLARQAHPDHPQLNMYLAVALQETGRHGLALDLMDQLVKAQPAIPALWLNRGHTLQLMGRLDEARDSYQRFMDLSQNRADMDVQRAWVSNQLGKKQ